MKSKMRLILLYANIILVFANVTFNKFRRKSGVLIASSNMTSSHVMSSCMACVVLCNREPGCSVTSWSPDDHVCRMTSRTSLDVWSGGQDNSTLACTFQKAWWKVWTVKGWWGTYSLTFEHAGEACQAGHGRLVTPEELLAERALGYEYCACGWLADRTVGYVMHEANPACYPQFNTGIIYCNFDLAMAHCIQ